MSGNLQISARWEVHVHAVACGMNPQIFGTVPDRGRNACCLALVLYLIGVWSTRTEADQDNALGASQGRKFIPRWRFTPIAAHISM